MKLVVDGQDQTDSLYRAILARRSSRTPEGLAGSRKALRLLGYPQTKIDSILGRVVQKFNPYHDELGRFTSVGYAQHAVVSEETKAHQERAVLNRLTDAERASIHQMEAAIKATSYTWEDPLYTLPGSTEKNPLWTDERKAIHEEILAKFKEKMDKFITDDPTLVMLGGRPAAGKSTTVKKINADNKFFVLSADDVKDELPDYDGLKASLFHVESSELTEKLVEYAATHNVNMIMDATMKTYQTALDKITFFKKMGYKIEGAYVYLPPKEAAYRSIKRAWGDNARYVPISVVLSNTHNEANFNKLKSHFSKWAMYDNSNTKPGQLPPKIAHGRKRIKKFNKNHDEIGRFASGSGGGHSDYYWNSEEYKSTVAQASEDQWNKLTKEEKFALDEYSGSGSSFANHYVTDPIDFAGDRGERPDVALRVWNVQSAIDKSQLPVDMVLWRGMNVDRTNIAGSTAQLGNMIGKDYEDPQFSSTSIFSEDALRFMAKGGNRVLVRIEAPKGSNGLLLLDHSLIKGEGEVILPDHSKFHIMSVEDRDGTTMLRVKLLPSKTTVQKYNENHDDLGRFATGPGGGIPPIGDFSKTPEPTPEPVFDLDAYNRRLVKATSKDWNDLSLAVRNTVRGYTNTGYSAINGLLGGAAPAAGNEFWQSEIANMRTAMEKMTIPEDITVYRMVKMDKLGVSGNAFNESLKTLMGKDYSEPVFGSTSISQKVASGFYRSGRAMVEIQVPKGSHGIVMMSRSGQPDEYEVILPDHSLFTITGVENTKFGYMLKAKLLTKNGGV